MKPETKNIEDYIKKMNQRGFDCSNLLGCTVEEITILEAKYHVSLPASYRSFLLRLGKNNNLVDKSEYSIDYDSVLTMTEKELLSIKEVQEEILAEGLDEEVLELPVHALLFLKRCDESQFYFILAEGGEDSPVYYYNTDLNVIEKERDSFWEILDMFVEGRKVS
jgi:hypothetical protein